jgi:serine/threonine protein kinase
MALNPGTKLGPYEILSLLEAGGMGEVYRARDTRLDRTVAVKILSAHLSSNPEARERFEREARAISSLNHPNICTIHDIGEEQGEHFIVLEHMEGATLKHLIAGHPLETDMLLGWLSRWPRLWMRRTPRASCTGTSSRPTCS